MILLQGISGILAHKTNSNMLNAYRYVNIFNKWEKEVIYKEVNPSAFILSSFFPNLNSTVIADTYNWQ